ncbi:centromere-associated protein E-like [Chrysoperla carnea]|uniref:centromere-associated protein E-like n=1 Tax=Chrysoperla carnea TaxID=189513 RepID=UPI001D09723B|nr:centromere-associated protein E-like [Chrysoperla carnea]
MSKDGQDDKNVNNNQIQLNDNNSSNNQGQKENTSTNNDAITPEAVTSPSNANISGEQNTSQINSEYDKVLGEEGTANDPVGVEQNEINNKKEQSSLGTNIGDTQDKAESVNANKDSTEPDKQNADSIDKDLKQLLSRIYKGEPTQKLEDDQVKNVLGDIKAQMASATNNYAELGRLAGALASLAASTNNPELLATIKSMLNAVESREETAKEVIRNDATSDNLEAQEHPDPEMIYNDPNSLTEEQKRLARGQYRSTEEKEQLEREACQDIDFAKRTHELHRDLNHAIEHEHEQLNIIAQKIEVEQNLEGKDELLQKKQQYETNISLYKERLEQHINPAIAELDLEREKLLKVVETHPDLVKERIRTHFKGNITRYQEIESLKGETKAIKEMEQLIKKAGLEKELNVKSNVAVDLSQSPVPTTLPSPSNVPYNSKRHNIFEETLNIRSTYKSGGIPKENLKDIMSHYAERRKCEADEAYKTDVILREISDNAKKDSTWDLFLNFVIGVKETAFYVT